MVGRYEINVPRIGLYHVDLFFAETFYTFENQRMFDVLLEGILILVEENYDIVQRAGGTNLTATRVTQTIAVQDFPCPCFWFRRLNTPN
jgi:Malectin domain